MIDKDVLEDKISDVLPDDILSYYYDSSEEELLKDDINNLCEGLEQKIRNFGEYIDIDYVLESIELKKITIEDVYNLEDAIYLEELNKIYVPKQTILASVIKSDNLFIKGLIDALSFKGSDVSTEMIIQLGLCT